MRAARRYGRAGLALSLVTGLVLTAGPLAAQTRTDRAPVPPAGTTTPPPNRPASEDRATSPADTQKSPAPSARDEKSSLSRSVTGTVKRAGEDALVIEETKRDGSGGKEWAFTVEGSTRTHGAKDGKAIKAGELKEGDRVAVTYTERGGRIVADSVTVLGGASPR